MSGLQVVLCRDAPNSAAPREAAQVAHFAHVERILDRIAVSGPLRDAEGRATGSLLILRVIDAAEAEAIMRAAPYYIAGVWAEMQIETFLPAAGDWIGETVWKPS